MSDVAVGIDLGGTDIKAGVVTPEGKILGQWKRPTLASQGPEELLKRILEFVADIMREKHISKTPQGDQLRLLGIGMGSPGAIDHVHGIVAKATGNLPGWSGMRLGEIISQHFGVPAYIDNDANCFVLGEFLFGAGKGKTHIAGLTLGTGIGGGIVIDGRLYHGGRGYAAEFGHISYQPDGRPCNCGGGPGCIEAYASATTMARMAAERLASGASSSLRQTISDFEQLTSKDVYEAAVQGDAFALEQIRLMGRNLGVAIASIVATLNPDLVVIGGGGANMGEMLFGPIREEVRCRVFFEHVDPTPIVPAELKEDAGLAGAAGLVFLGK